MTKLTFKKDKKETGLRSVGRPYPNTRVKWDDAIVGRISAPSLRSGQWTVGFMVCREPTPESPAPFAWVGVGNQHCFESEPEARLWIQRHQAEILALDLFRRDAQE